MKPPVQKDHPGRPPRRVAAVPLDARVELVQGDQVSRILITMIGDFLARLNRERRLLYDGDLDLASVFEIIGTSAITHAMRDAEFREKHGTFSSVVGIEGQRGTNAMSISAGTGIPRETVRRKIKRLRELGLIVEKTRGHYVVNPGTFLKPHYQAAFGRGLRETVNFINQCLEQGVMRWVPSTDASNTARKD